MAFWSDGTPESWLQHFDVEGGCKQGCVRSKTR